jgi:hypothetical protein
VEVAAALGLRGFLTDGRAGYSVTDAGRAWFRALGIEIRTLTRRPLARRCLDWSERRYHLAGALGVAMTDRMLELNWIAKVRGTRALRLTDRGAAALRSELGVELRSESGRAAR